MATAPTNARPTPERIFNTLNAYQQTHALNAAIELDVFTVIADGANDVASIAKKTGAAERGIQTLCNYLTIIGFLTKENGRFALTPESSIFLNNLVTLRRASADPTPRSQPARARFSCLAL